MKDGSYTEAEALQQRLLAITRVVLGQYGVAGLKAALQLTGVDVGPPRPPLCPVDDEATRAVAAALSSFEGVPA